MKSLRLSLLFAVVPAALVASSSRAQPAATPPSASASTSVSAAPVDPRRAGFAPDPPPLVTRRKWRYEILWHHGAVFAGTPVAVDKPRPTETPRTMGRFMVELWIGKEIVERVRFELPMLDGDAFTGEKKRPFGAPPDLERKVTVKQVVEVPDSDRATMAFFVDRATGKRTRLFWPRTDAPPPPASASAAPAASSP